VDDPSVTSGDELRVYDCLIHTPNNFTFNNTQASQVGILEDRNVITGTGVWTNVSQGASTIHEARPLLELPCAQRETVRLFGPHYASLASYIGAATATTLRDYAGRPRISGGPVDGGHMQRRGRMVVV
jgi:hypothetical protein